MKIYHLLNEAKLPDIRTMCGNPVLPNEEIVSMSEVLDPQGKHFNCTMCDMVLHKGKRHVEPPNE